MRRNGPSTRKERRKTARVTEKAKDAPTTAALKQRHNGNGGLQKTTVEAQVLPTDVVATDSQTKPLKSILKKSKVGLPSNSSHTVRKSRTPSQTTYTRPPKGVRERLAADDAEIAALEKALGIGGGKKLPESFAADGLDVLLEGLSDSSADDKHTDRKRKRLEEQQWLLRKRQKAERPDSVPIGGAAGNLLEVEASSEDDEATTAESLPDINKTSDQDFEDDEPFESFSECSPPPDSAAKKFRENPYIAPATPSDVDVTSKYIPPFSRGKDITALGDLSRLRRRMQGLLNRLSEANMAAIMKGFEELYRVNPRQDVSRTLLDVLLDLLGDSTTLQDTFIILHAGFIAALHKVIGSDFGAQAVSRIIDEFEELCRTELKADVSSKKLPNLVNLLAHLYNFRVIGSSLVFDLSRLFLEDLSEMNTELLLKIIRSKCCLIHC